MAGQRIRFTAAQALQQILQDDSDISELSDSDNGNDEDYALLPGRDEEVSEDEDHVSEADDEQDEQSLSSGEESALGIDLPVVE